MNCLVQYKHKMRVLCFVLLLNLAEDFPVYTIVADTWTKLLICIVALDLLRRI